MKDNQWKFELLRTIMALGIAIGILFVIIFFVSDDPGNAIFHLFLGPIQNLPNFSSVITKMVPLLFTGIAMSIIFSADTMNLATEGAFYIGALATAGVAILVPAPTIVLLPLSLLVGAIFGAIVTGIPGVLKYKTNSDEMVVSLMLNYVCVHLGIYFLNHFIKDHTISGNASLKFPAGMEMARIVPGTRIHIGIIIALVLVVITYLAMYKTPWGLKVRITGDNQEFARFSGINVPMTALSTQLLGGLAAGLGGGVEQLAMYQRFRWDTSPQYGWDGVLIATLARNNPAYVPLASFFLAYLRVGSEIMNRNSDVPYEVLEIVQGIIIILIVGKKLTARIERRALYKEAKVSQDEGVKEGVK